MTAALVDAPSQTKTYDGSSIESQVRANAESILTALGYATFGRYDIEQRMGGNPADNSSTDYSTRVSEAERSLIETVSPGSTDKLLAELAAGERLTADAAAQEKFAESGTPTGAVQDPTITMHTKSDPLVLVQNETLFKQRYQALARAPVTSCSSHGRRRRPTRRHRCAVRRRALQLHPGVTDRRDRAARQLGEERRLPGGRGDRGGHGRRTAATATCSSQARGRTRQCPDGTRQRPDGVGGDRRGRHRARSRRRPTTALRAEASTTATSEPG